MTKEQMTLDEAEAAMKAKPSQHTVDDYMARLAASYLLGALTKEEAVSRLLAAVPVMESVIRDIAPDGVLENVEAITAQAPDLPGEIVAKIALAMAERGLKVESVKSTVIEVGADGAARVRDTDARTVH